MSDFEQRVNKTKDLMEEYIQLHTESIKHEHGEDSYMLKDGKMSPHYRLGLVEANLEYILINSDAERERFEELVKYQRQKKEQRAEAEERLYA